MKDSSKTIIKTPSEKSSYEESSDEEEKHASRRPIRRAQVSLSAKDLANIDKEAKRLKKSCASQIKKHSELDMGGQVIRSLYESNYIQASRYSNEATLKPSGRPEVIRIPDEEEMEDVFEGHFNGKKILKKKQRSDAKNTTTIRHIKKFPDAILKHMGSKCQYKSKELDMVLRQYLLCFKEGYLKFCDLDPSEDLVKHFLDFIVLSFPESKVFAILEILERKAFLLHCLNYKSLVEQLVIRKYSSKRMLGYLYSSNICLQHI